jgi:hypothetical protein
MSAVWRRTGERVVQGVPFREALAQARHELERAPGLDLRTAWFGTPLVPEHFIAPDGSFDEAALEGLEASEA